MKNKSFFSGAIAVAIIFILGSIWAGFYLSKPKILPIYNPSQIAIELVDSSLHQKTNDHTIAPFSLTSQLDNVFTDKEIDNTIYVADFFFVSCKTICPVMTDQLARVHDVYRERKDFKILSHSVLPDMDTPEILKEYADQHKANHDSWIFLTGNKEAIYELARKSYFLVKPAEVGQGDGGESDFIHTNNFVLIDKNKRIRGYYDGTNSDEVTQLINDIEILYEEYENMD